ncbi:MAG: VWA domain-containing protein, partial [Chloroflexales bacterium]|nr:VWA domain-containing protein [Chloroflexales bacterium]
TCQKPESLGSTELNEQVNIELILDSSGSMAEDAGGRPKLDIAKEVLGGFVDTLPKQANVALRVYGHVGSNSEADRALSCGKSELLSPFQPLNAASFKSTINALEPRGWTPIASSLQQAQQDFAAYGDAAKNSNLIYLVSDGIETCDGDPVAAARALKEANIRAVVNVVGFAVDTVAAQQLRAAAEAGGGQYYEARNAAELQEVFKQRFDWAAWTGYYNCRVAAATGEFNQDVAQQTAALNCTIAKATTELNSVIASITTQLNSRAVSKECYDYIAQKIKARYDRISTATKDSYDSAIDVADQEYRDAVDSAKEDYQQTPTP